MKKLCLFFLLTPLLLTAQDDEAPQLVFHSALMSAKAGQADAFESAMTAHNKAFHADGTYGARVYNIVTGADVGKYLWVLGPTPWAALDHRPGKGAHDDDWDKVLMHAESDAYTGFWSLDTKHSHFPADFDIDKTYVMYVDVKRNGGKDVSYLLDKVKKVYAETMPDETYGIYWNQTGSTAQGRDLMIIWFFDSWAWMGEDSGFEENFAEVYGEGSWDRWLEDWTDATDGTEIEIWAFREDLSGVSSKIPVAERQ